MVKDVHEPTEGDVLVMDFPLVGVFGKVQWKWPIGAEHPHESDQYSRRPAICAGIDFRNA